VHLNKRWCEKDIGVGVRRHVGPRPACCVPGESGRTITFRGDGRRSESLLDFRNGNPAGLPGASLQQCSRAQAAVAAAEASRRNRAQCQPAHCPHPYTPHDAGSSSCCIQAIRSHSFAGTTPPTRAPGEKRSEGPKLWNHLSLRSLAPLPGLYASGSGLQ
jgi:hypothetical protein